MKKFVEVTSLGHKEVEEFDILFCRSRSKVEGLKYPKLTSPKKKKKSHKVSQNLERITSRELSRSRNVQSLYAYLGALISHFLIEFAR